MGDIHSSIVLLQVCPIYLYIMFRNSLFAILPKRYIRFYQKVYSFELKRLLLLIERYAPFFTPYYFNENQVCPVNSSLGNSATPFENQVRLRSPILQGYLAGVAADFYNVGAFGKGSSLMG